MSPTCPSIGRAEVMTQFEDAVLAIGAFLEAEGIPHMVIGGVANLFWGVPRTTLDVDVTVWVEEIEIPQVIPRFADRFRLLSNDPVEFVKETRVLPMETERGFRVDVIFGSLPFERAAIRRARLMSVAGQRVRICTAEDLIITKIVSDRPRDREDVAGIIRAQGVGLDRGYLDPLIEGLAAELGRPDLLDFYRRCVSEEV